MSADIVMYERRTSHVNIMISYIVFAVFYSDLHYQYTSASFLIITNYLLNEKLAHRQLVETLKPQLGYITLSWTLEQSAVRGHFCSHAACFLQPSKDIPVSTFLPSWL